MTTAALIVAAGSGLRAGGGRPKQWRPLGQTTVAGQCLASIRAAKGIDRILMVIHPDFAPEADALGVAWVAGGPNRTASVRAGLEALAQQGVTRVLIHDVARPLIPASVVQGVLEALDTHAGAAPALAVTDALWRGDSSVDGAVPRDGLFRAQTPQGFNFEAILAAHRAFDGEAADDVEIARAAGLAVAITAGDERNMKITTPEDFGRVEKMMRDRMDIRLGNGFDVHRFGSGDHVWLCGVKVPHGRGLQGHSDADVGMHALTDAIYGALAEGDIGRHFPPSDPQWKGADSAIFLAHAADLARARGFAISNCDVTLICERPKVGPHAQAMQDRLAAIMGIEAARVSVKATTSERLGFTGREEGIASIATATLISQ